MHRAKGELRAFGCAESRMRLGEKERIFLGWWLRAYRVWRDSFWEMGVGALRELAADRGWGEAPASIAFRVVRCRKNWMETRMAAAEVCAKTFTFI